MSERGRKMLSELEQLGRMFGARPARAAEQPDLVEIRPGVWVEAPRAGDKAQRAQVLEGLGQAVGLEPDEMQALEGLWKP